MYVYKKKLIVVKMSLVIIGTKTCILQYQEFNIQSILYHVAKLHWMLVVGSCSNHPRQTHNLPLDFNSYLYYKDPHSFHIQECPQNNWFLTSPQSEEWHQTN